MKRFDRLLVTGGTFQAFLLFSDGAPRKPPRLADTHIAACHVEDFRVYQALYNVARMAHVPIGVEAVVDSKSPKREVSFDFPGGTLADLLNRLVSQAPEYRWSEDNGIIHVLWHGEHLPIAEVLMAYPGAQHKTVEEIWLNLAARPELKAWLEANHCFRHELFDETGPAPHFSRISIHAGSMTLAQLLDRAAIKSGENYWLIIQSPPDKPCEVSIFMW